jgi:DNA-binding transcriptional LysR family regulator
MMKLTHRHIDVFYTLMTTSTITAAAKALYSSQPTISRELARIEDIAGFLLFERIKGRLKPTVNAYLLFEEIKSSYVGLDKVSDMLKSLKERSVGQLSLIAQPTFAHTLIPGACNRFKAITKETNISILLEDSPFLERKLSNQLFDLGITEKETAPVDTYIESIFEGNEVCVLPSGHPLLEKKEIEVSDFEGQDFINLSPNDPYRIKLDRIFDENNIKRNHVIETSSATSLCCLVRSGLGIGIINPLTAYDFKGADLKIRPISFSHLFKISLILPKYRSQNPLTKIFIDALKEDVKRVKSSSYFD